MDQETDLAVIKIEMDHPLPVAKLGNSDGMQVGELGAGHRQSLRTPGNLTAGIVSAKDATSFPTDSSSPLFRPMRH